VMGDWAGPWEDSNGKSRGIGHLFQEIRLEDVDLIARGSSL